jgi:5,10-methylenetetrahydrofolate reductase
MRKWLPSDATVYDEWKVICQIVVPEKYRKKVMSLADDSKITEHLGFKKASNMILATFHSSYTVASDGSHFLINS